MFLPVHLRYTLAKIVAQYAASSVFRITLDGTVLCSLVTAWEYPISRQPHALFEKNQGSYSTAVFHKSCSCGSDVPFSLSGW